MRIALDASIDCTKGRTKMTTHQCKIIAYTYEADYHCIDCTIKAFGFLVARIRRVVPRREPHAVYGHLIRDLGAVSCEIFDCDEWQELDESFLEENPTQYLACGDCHAIIDEYTVTVA